MCSLRVLTRLGLHFSHQGMLWFYVSVCWHSNQLLSFSPSFLLRLPPLSFSSEIFAIRWFLGMSESAVLPGVVSRHTLIACRVSCHIHLDLLSLYLLQGQNTPHYPFLSSLPGSSNVARRTSFPYWSFLRGFRVRIGILSKHLLLPSDVLHLFRKHRVYLRLESFTLKTASTTVGNTSSGLKVSLSPPNLRQLKCYHRCRNCL